MSVAKKTKTSAPSKLADKMYDLFRSNQRSVGHFDPKSSRMHTEYHGPTVEDFQKHIVGTDGLGCVPINDEETCHWAAIDIDNHGEDDDVPIAPIDAIINSERLPLIACRSKSGGVHAYLFMGKAQSAGWVQDMMGKWAAKLGYPKAEIFPKQRRLPLSTSTNKRQLGNWINLPYLGGDETIRYAWHNGKKLTLNEFIERAQKLRQGEDELKAHVVMDHAQAPPCVQKMLSNGVGAGHRNEALYQITIYTRKRNPDGYETEAIAVNNAIFDKPLPKGEMLRTIRSAGREDCKYRCNEEPARSLCDRDTCLKRKFGISKLEADMLAVESGLPAFSELVKYLSEPVRWDVKIDDQKIINLSTGQLLEWKIMQEMIAEKLMKVVPLIKNIEWHRVLAPLMREARVVDTPADASLAGVVRERLYEFLSKADLSSDGIKTDDRRALLRGLPVVQVLDGDRQAIFRAQDFINYLKRTKSEELKGVNLWFTVRDIGVGHSKLRVGDKSCNVWHLPVNMIIADEPKPPTFRSKL